MKRLLVWPIIFLLVLPSVARAHVSWRPRESSQTRCADPSRGGCAPVTCAWVLTLPRRAHAPSPASGFLAPARP